MTAIHFFIFFLLKPLSCLSSLLVSFHTVSLLSPCCLLDSFLDCDWVGAGIVLKLQFVSPPLHRLSPNMSRGREGVGAMAAAESMSDPGSSGGTGTVLLSSQARATMRAEKAQEDAACHEGSTTVPDSSGGQGAVGRAEGLCMQSAKMDSQMVPNSRDIVWPPLSSSAVSTLINATAAAVAIPADAATSANAANATATTAASAKMARNVIEHNSKKGGQLLRLILNPH